MLIAAGLIIAGLIVLVLGAEGLVRGAAALSARLGMPQFVIGLTVVGFGTSMPELCASVMAAIRGSVDLSVGNVVGSNIANLALILGLTALLRPMAIALAAVRVELGWMIAASILPLATLATGGTLGRVWGIAALAMLVVYTARGIAAGRREPRGPEAEMEAGIAALVQTPRRDGVWREIAMTLVGLAALIAGSAMLVEGAVRIARGAGMSELVIGLTIVAVGTSLPELATSVTAALRGKPELALGNVLGSNVFNVFGILGIAALVRPQRLEGAALSIDVPVMIALSVATAAACVSGRRLARWEGAVLLLAYGGYITALLLR